MNGGRVNAGGLAISAVPRVIALLVAIAAGVVAWKVGGGADSPSSPPRLATGTGASDGGVRTNAATSGETYEVSTRLVEIAKDARFEMSDLGVFRSVMRAHWRQLSPPFMPPAGDGARFVATVSLRMSASETQWAMPVGKDSTPWAPDARIWNMNEGTFDQRESLVSTTPGLISVRVTVPQAAKLSFAEGTVNATEQATVFGVTVIDGKGTRHDVYRHAVPPGAARRWHDASCDLSAFAGQDVELRLSTEAVAAGGPGAAVNAGAGAAGRAGAAGVAPEASEYSGPGNGKATIDGGVIREDVLATPSSAIALWGNPTILRRTTPSTPFNVVWVVVDALRPDVIASFHDDAEDAAKRAAPVPPLEALLPKVPGVTPAIDDLVKRGARFTSAYSAGSWTRPGTLAMLSGARSSELGIETTEWMLTPGQLRRFYTSDPPLLSLVLRRHNVTTRAFVNNYFMAGYAPVGLDMGFERVDDVRYRTRDTLEITHDATEWIKANKDVRFFAFVNYNSPHEPYEPPARDLERVPPPPIGPKDDIARLYMAEAAKDDEAIGVLMRTLDETGLSDNTIVIVTSDHGETMSSAHDGVSGLDKIPIRYHHSASNFEETTKVPIVIVAPSRIAPGTEVKSRVRSIDIAPTVLDLLGLEPHVRMSGRSMVPLAKGQKESEERIVVSEGRGSRSIIFGRHRMILREGAAKIVMHGDQTREREVELFDLVDDPGERRDLASKRPDLVAEMRARLDAALKNVAVAGSADDSRGGAAGTAGTGGAGGADGGVVAPQLPTLFLRFSGGPTPRRVSGTIRLGDAKTKVKTKTITPIDLGRDVLREEGDKIDVAFRTSPDVAVGFDVVVDPPGAPIGWEIYLDDKPWPDVFGGPYGLLAPALRKGIASEDARQIASSTLLPTIDTHRDVGLFVTRERRGDGAASETSDEGAEEMARLLREWGYAKGSGSTGKR